MTSNPVISKNFEWNDVEFTDVGKVRKVNEDSMMSRSDQAHRVVADGMGGHEAGDVASQSICTGLAGLTRQREFPHFVDDIEDKIIEVNGYLRRLAGDDDDKVIGSTVVGLALQGNHAVYYWVGDSRVYRLRGGTLTQLSIDHTYLQELVDEGKLDPADVADHNDKNVITRAVGADDDVFVDFEMEQFIDKDIYFLCSDGVEKEMTDEEVEGVLNRHGSDIESAGKEIIDQVLDRGSPDNVTVILVQIKSKGAD